jgi:hypothetical protein
LIVCNPPWLPARPCSLLEQAVYDPDSRMLRGFLNGLVEHLTPAGQAWLILSDLAEHLELRSRDELLSWIAQAGLVVTDKMDIKPRHNRALDVDDLLHAARAAEITSLWCLKSLIKRNCFNKPQARGRAPNIRGHRRLLTSRPSIPPPKSSR